jgi:hypothetical protein
VDLDPSLPNIGFRLGLAPPAYLVTVLDVPPSVERGALGIRVVTVTRGAGSCAEVVTAAALHADVVVVRIPPGDPSASLLPLGSALALPATATTMERAASRSPMFDAWMATARRPQRPRPAATVSRLEDLLDVVVRVGEAPVVAALGGVPVRPLAWGDAAAAAGWARVPAHAPPAHVPLALLDPEHPVARVFESLAQALLAGLGRRAGGDARA